jgi:hypothetical protein
MARRNSTATPNPESNEESPVTVTPEAVEESTTEPTPEVEPKKEVVIDLTAFKAAAENAVAESDQSTGEIAPLFVDAVVKEYRTLEGLKAKNAAKAWLNEQMKDKMMGDSISGARSYLQLHDSMTAGSSGSGAPKAPVDPTEAFVQAEATLRLAATLHQPGEGVAEGWAEKVEETVNASLDSATAYLAWMKSDDENKGDEPEVTSVVKNAVKLALGKAAKAGSRQGGGNTYTGERRDIAKHIVAAFEGVDEGTFLTVAEIRNIKSEEYGDNPPSAGAISARLFPASGKCTVEGVVPDTNEKGKKGARKAA